MAEDIKKRTYAFNAVPTSHIIAETSFLPDGLRTYLKEMREEGFEDKWRSNNESSQLNACEVIPEIVSRLMDHREWLELEGKNKDYLKMMIQNSDDMYFNHSSCTVAFGYVSFNFIKKVLEFRYPDITLSDKKITIPKFGFWIPPYFDNDDKRDLFSQIFANMNDIKDGIITNESLEGKSLDYINNFIEDISRIYPQGVQVCCCLTAGMGTWRDIFKKSATYKNDNEMRFTMLHLAYKMKKRYGNIFQDMSICDESGKLYGLDSLLSYIDAWKQFQIHFAS